LKEMFKFPQSLGILGGRPRASYYFVACQDDDVFYLDPKLIQSYILGPNTPRRVTPIETRAGK